MKPKKIGITDATYKHSLALSRYLTAYRPDVEVVGISSHRPKWQRVYHRHYTRFVIGTLREIHEKEQFDLIIPVGNASIESALQLSLKNAILPSASSVQTALNKQASLQLADRLGVPTPKTFFIHSLDELADLEMFFPCVVKGALEAGKNVVFYPKNREELRQAVLKALQDPSQKQRFPLIQEYIPGAGMGFFGYYQNGILKRFYMHERIREFPISGGASTAAKTTFHEKAFEYGKKILDALEWHGPAMVEFKYFRPGDCLVLMEVNPKFWGSTELGLAAGINFGELLLRTIEGEDLVPDTSPESYKKIKFLWPFEGDLLAIIQSRQWKKLFDYVFGRYECNVRANGMLLNFIRLYQFLRWR
jgi:predicted ATP-grasp superfamily ATP-dependent carboligase